MFKDVTVVPAASIIKAMSQQARFWNVGELHRTTRLNVSEDSCIQIPRREDLKSHPRFIGITA
jgi:hypothetical protein